MKGVVLAAGKGKRLRPLTYAVPKEMLHIAGKPVLEYILESIKIAGVDTVFIVTGWKKHALIDYFGNGSRMRMNIFYAVQNSEEFPERKGIAYALKIVRPFLMDEEFVVVLGDSLFTPDTFVKEIIDFHRSCADSSATIGVIPVKNISRYGIIQPRGNLVERIVEKPVPLEAPSDLGALGVYVFSPRIFDAIHSITPGAGGEYQLTDAIQRLIDEGEKVYYKVLNGIHWDVGTITDLIDANEYFTKTVNKRRFGGKL